MTSRLPARALLAAAALAIAALPVAAQYTEDDQTGDWAERDRQYLERLRRQQEQGDVPADVDAVRDAFLAEAERLVRDRDYDAATSAHYSVQTDDPRVDPEHAAALLELFRAHLEATWPGEPDLSAVRSPSRVFLLYSFYEFNELLGGEWRRSLLRPGGHYETTLDAITLHSDGSPPGDLADSLVHEAAHQLIESGLYPDNALPTWVSEGLATYYGHTLLDRDGVFRSGTIGGKALPLMRRGSFPAGQEARSRLRAARQALKGDDELEGPLVERILAADTPQRFYGPGVQVHYAGAWLLVHYLLHGDDGAHAAAFHAWIDAAAAGRPEPLPDSLGIDLATLDEGFRAHVRGLDAEVVTASEDSYRGSLSPSTTTSDAPGSSPSTR